MGIGRIVWFSESPLTFSGGGERLLLEGLHHLSDLGIDAALYADGAPIDRERVFNGAYAPKVIVARKGPGSLGILGKVPIIRHFLRLRVDALAMASHQPDYIIANSQYSAALLLKMKAMGLLRGIPFACFIHGSLFQFRNDRQKYAWIFRSRFRMIWENDEVYRRTIPEKRPPMLLMDRLEMEFEVIMQYLGVRKSRALFVLTTKNQKEMRLQYGHRNIRVAHGAFPRAILGHGQKRNWKPAWGMEGKRVLLSICRLEEKKQVDLILRGFAELHSRDPNVALVIGGTGPVRQTLEALANDLGIFEAVRFAGFVPDEDLYGYYLSADAFTSADIADYDITTLVALALGIKAVVSSQHDFEAGLAELHQLFHAEPTPGGFAKAFAQALSSPQPCDPPTRAKLLEDYTWEAYFAKVKGIMEEDLPHRRGKAG